jgi:hypothetical protein
MAYPLMKGTKGRWFAANFDCAWRTGERLRQALEQTYPACHADVLSPI